MANDTGQSGTDTTTESSITALDSLLEEFDTLGASVLEQARAVETGDRKAGAEVLAQTARIGRAWQAFHGLLLLMLGQVQRTGAVPGGLDAWIATHLDVTRGSARGIMQQARAISAVPELAAPLVSGGIGPGTISALTRTARAVRHENEQTRRSTLHATLDVARNHGADKAKRYVQILEETITPGRARQQLSKARERSFLRVSETGSGMCRIEALLDPERGTTFRAILDQTVSAFLRARQYDQTELVPEDVHTTEQLQAEALVRMAQNFAHADPSTRGVKFAPPTLYTAPLDHEEDAGLAESVYGTMVARDILPPPGHPAARLLEHDADGQPVLLDGQRLDQDPAARLASPAQRTALAWRDRTCTHPGCDRPPPFSLHAHHKIPHSHNGPTSMENLTLLCAKHHHLAHLDRA